MRSVPWWLPLATLSVMPWLMAPGAPGCGSCARPREDEHIYITLGAHVSTERGFHVADDGHYHIDAVVTSGSAALDVEALDDGIEDLSCQRGAGHVSCTFIGETGSDIAVTMRTTNSAAKVTITSDLAHAASAL
jgi:hypothetical protein